MSRDTDDSTDGERRDDDSRGPGRTGFRGALDRRGVLAALGAGTAVSVAGTAFGGGGRGAQETPTPTETEADGGNGTATSTAEPPGEPPSPVRPAFGFPAYDETDPPVEPDHTIELVERQREDPDRVPELFFEPTGLYIEPGDTVLFDVTSPYHTVTAYHPDLGYNQRIPEGAAPVNSPLLWVPRMYFLYTFRTAGVYDLFCAPHEWYGMVVRIVNGEATGPGAEPLSEIPPGLPEPEPLPEAEPLYPPWGAARTVLSDPALDPQTIVEQGSVSWDEIAAEARETPTATPSPTFSPTPTPTVTPPGDGNETDPDGNETVPDGNESA